MMRLYDFECVECGQVFEHLCADNEPVHCPMCNSVRCDRLPPAVNINMGVGAYGYWDETLETYIGSNRARREAMRRHGVTEKGGTPKPDGEAWV